MDAETRNYRQRELDKLVDNNKGFQKTIKIWDNWTFGGETFHLAITNEEFEQIKKILTA